MTNSFFTSDRILNLPPRSSYFLIDAICFSDKPNLAQRESAKLFGLNEKRLLVGCVALLSESFVESLTSIIESACNKFHCATAESKRPVLIVIGGS